MYDVLLTQLTYLTISTTLPSTQEDKQREDVIAKEAEVERERVKQVRKLLRDQNEAKKKIEIEAKRKKVICIILYML